MMKQIWDEFINKDVNSLELKKKKDIEELNLGHENANFYRSLSPKGRYKDNSNAKITKLNLNNIFNNKNQITSNNINLSTMNENNNNESVNNFARLKNFYEKNIRLDETDEINDSYNNNNNFNSCRGNIEESLGDSYENIIIYGKKKNNNMNYKSFNNNISEISKKGNNKSKLVQIKNEIEIKRGKKLEIFPVVIDIDYLVNNY